ncbi:MAG: DUF1786 family protein [Syntrophobacteraceae bacterium]
MSRFLLVDIGAGTMDILYYDDALGVHYKAVAKSPVMSIAEDAAAMPPGDLLVLGCEMGGGSISQALKDRAKEADVVMSASAALTVNHDLERVRSYGIRVVPDAEADDVLERAARDRRGVLRVGDVEPDRLEEIVLGLGVPYEFDAVAFCAQDHGAPPPGVSHLDYRHAMYKERLDRSPFPHMLLYRKDEIPPTFNRLRSIAASAEDVPTDEIYVMDSGMAAILGASLDLHAVGKRSLVLDVATSHTVGAAIEDGEIAGFFEYHTHDVTMERVESLLHDLADGALEHEQILKEGGHGAYIRKSFGFDAAEVIIATGPKRKIMQKSQLPIIFGGPLGDNMMTGTVGLLEAVRRRKGLAPMLYL